MMTTFNQFKFGHTDSNSTLTLEVNADGCQEIVDEFKPHHNSVIFPEKLITALAVSPRGAWPSYASGYYERDNEQYIAWDEVSKERESFNQWLEAEVFSKGEK